MKKSFRTTYACILAAVMGHMLSAAEPSGFTIRGIIYHKTDKGVEPVDMAVVSVPEFTIGGSTNLQGEYLLQNVPSGKVRLTVHSLGYVPVDTTISVTADRTLNFVMKADNFRLDEVVVARQRKFHIRLRK